MRNQSVSIATVQTFLSQKRIAMVGISRHPKEFSVMLFEEFCRRGYDMVPVNPNLAQVLGRQCFARLQDINPPVEGAILMTPPNATETVVRDCAEAGIWRVWMYRAGGQGAVSPRAVEFCRAHGIEVVPGECPFMFWRDAHAGHRIHGFIRWVMGAYPRDARSMAG